MDLPEQFSFSKKPIAPNGKRLSVISATIPDSQNTKRSSTSSTGSNSSRTSSLTNQIQRTGRTFSHAENLIEELPTDNPLLDYDEQIRAPKFAVASRKSLEDIGGTHEEFKSHDHDSDKADSISPSPLDSSAAQEHANRKYQPAKVALSSSTYGLSPTPSTSVNNNYTLTHITSMNVISNFDSTAPTSENTSPISSKKNSDDSIMMLSAKKTPRFDMAPVRPVDDPRTPNYIPAVLRPTQLAPLEESTASAFEDYSADVSNGVVSREHWKPNSSCSSCTDCGAFFTIINRRHHCRKCGDIFCGQCLLSKAKLSSGCKFDVNGTVCKVCFRCGKEWAAYLVQSFKVDLLPDYNKGSSQSQGKSNAAMVNEQIEQEGKGAQREMSNVPADWSWSSF